MTHPSDPAPDRPLDPAYDDTGSHAATGSYDATGSQERVADAPPARTLPPAAVTTTKGPSRGGAHVSSLVLSLVLTPLALVAFDYSLVKGWGRGVVVLDNAHASITSIVALGVGAALLFVVAGLSRMSGLGPLVAGLVWGAGPTVAFALVPLTTAKRMLDLPNPYDKFASGLVSQSIVFAAVGALLIGAGLFGRWRRDRVVEPVTRSTGSTYAA